jgi:tetratricopeptide (TPR) repeat protein
MNLFPVTPNPSQVIERILFHAGQHHQRGYLDAAQDFLELATLVCPTNPDYITAFGSICGQTGHWAQAREAFTKLTQLKPGAVDSWIRLATACQRLEDQDAFETSLQRALDADPTHPVAIKMLAVHLLTHQEYAAAARLYHVLLQRNESEVDNLLGLAKCFFKLGDRDSARMVFERTLQLDPANALAREGVQVLNDAGATGAPEGAPTHSSGLRSQEIREPPCVSPAVPNPITSAPLQSLESNLTQIHQLLAQADAAQAAGRTQEAITTLRQAAALAPNTVAVWSSLGSLEYLHGDLTSAADAFLRATQLNSRDPILHVQHAMVLYKLGQLQDFERSLSFALDLDAKCEPALKLLGDLNFDCKRYAQAATVYSNMVNLNPGNLEVWLRLGKCLYELGNPQEAVDCYRQVLRLEPNNPIAQEALTVLQAPSLSSEVAESAPSLAGR